MTERTGRGASDGNARTSNGAAAAIVLATPEPHDLEAEEWVIGAMLAFPGVVESVRHLVDEGDFYRPSHGWIYSAARDIHDAGIVPDAITVGYELSQRHQLETIGEQDGDESGKERLRELATLVPAALATPFHADVVRKTARARTQARALRDALTEHETGAVSSERTLERLRVVFEPDPRAAAGAPLQWLSHSEVLQLEAQAERYLVDDLIPTAAVGTYAGVPESYKSWLAQATATRIASGRGWILGKRVVSQGPVGYLWQDDSTREEAERVKAFEALHPTPSHLPILWGLNLGIELPRDIGRLRDAVTQNNLVLLVLDSFYNFLPGVDLKDLSAGQVVSMLKREIADSTGCTVLIVDHMPWATEQNRQHLRPYGDVFKNAATRFGVYIDSVGDKLHVEARGNNIRGFAKRLAYWDADTLELKLVDGDQDGRAVKAPATEIRAWVEAQGGRADAVDVCAHFDISDDTLRKRKNRLKQCGVIYLGGQGSRAQLVLEESQAEQLETTPEVPESEQFPNAGTSPRSGTFPHNQADSVPESRESRNGSVRELEVCDLQGEQVPEDAAPLRGEDPPRGGRELLLRAAEAFAIEHAWLEDHPAVAILQRFPSLPSEHLERITALAEAKQSPSPERPATGAAL